MSRPDWDEYFLGIVKAVSARADCRRFKHACVIVSPRNKIVSTGYNGSLAGDTASCLEGHCPRGLKTPEELAHNSADYSDCIGLHAEQNAIAYANYQETVGGVAYLTGPPCNMCNKLLLAAGIERIVW